MATLMRSKPKKTKPKFIELNEPIVNMATDESAEQSTGRSENSRLLPKESLTDSCTVNIDNSPTAPSEDLYEYRPTGIANNKEERAHFMKKVFTVLFAQKSFFTFMITLFTYIPHLRKVVRKDIFDPLFMSSYVGIPLFIAPLVLMSIFPTLRRKLAIWAFLILTLCLSLLVSYALTMGTPNAFLYSMGFSNACDMGVIMGSKMKRDFTKWRYISLIPSIMVGSSFMAPGILGLPVKSTIGPSLAMTLGSTYLMANTVPVIRHNDLKIEPNEYVFAAIQLYLNPERSIRHKIKEWFCGSSNNQRDGYTSI